MLGLVVLAGPSKVVDWYWQASVPVDWLVVDCLLGVGSRLPRHWSCGLGGLQLDGTELSCMMPMPADSLNWCQSPAEQRLHVGIQRPGLLDDKHCAEAGRSTSLSK